MSIGWKGCPVTWRPLVAAAIWVSTPIAIRGGHVVGVRVMSTGVCYGARHNTDSERRDEHSRGFGHHDELLLKSAQFQRLCGRQQPESPVADYSPFAQLDDFTLRPKLVV
jgi:hypothetical protein